MTPSRGRLSFSKSSASMVGILAVLYVAYGLFLSLGSHAGFPVSMRTESHRPFLADQPLGEDAYYMLTIAWNIASGKGIVYNYDRVTTGIQPLSTFVYAGLGWIVQKCGGDKWAFARVILLFCSLCGLLFARQCGRIALHLAGKNEGPRSLTFGLAFIGTLFHVSLFGLMTYGLETALYILLLSCCVLFTLSLKDRLEMRMREAMLFGGLVGLTGLARIDFGVIIFLFFGVMLWRRRIRPLWAVAAGATALVVISPWFLWVKSVSGRWMPSSGSAQFAVITLKDLPYRIWSMAKSMIGHLTPWAYAGKKYFVLFAFLSFFAFLIWLARAKHVFRGLSESLRKPDFFAGWAIALSGIVVIYGLFFWAGHFYPRYTAPILVLLLPMAAVAAAGRLKSSSPVKKMTALAILPACFCFWAVRLYHSGTTAFSMSIAAGFIQKEYPAPHRVGAFQSGVLGFFNPQVFNLDGKVDPQALSYLKAGKIDAYIDREKIDVLIDWPGYLSTHLSDEYLKQNWTVRSEPILDGLISCYIRKNL